jgi:hypothetical protein
MTNIIHHANDNRNDLTKEMSPWGAALFSCFRSVNPQEQLAALDNLNKALEGRLGHGVPTDRGAL